MVGKEDKPFLLGPFVTFQGLLLLNFGGNPWDSSDTKKSKVLRERCQRLQDSPRFQNHHGNLESFSSQVWDHVVIGSSHMKISHKVPP